MRKDDKSEQNTRVVFPGQSRKVDLLEYSFHFSMQLHHLMPIVH